MEVAVVGAGPAGSYCAERLVGLGHRVTVFDPSHPREKPCGGGVTPVVFERHPCLCELKAAGRAVGRARLRTPDGRLLSVAIPQPIVIFSRRVLDGLLLQRACEAGARHRAERVIDVVRQRDGLRLRTETGEQGFDFVVGADGASSLVRRRLLGERPGGAGGWASAGFYVRGLPEREIYIEFLPDIRGYIWAFPRPDHSSVGGIVPIGFESGATLRRRVLTMLERRYPGSLALQRSPYGMSIPSPTPRQARWPKLGGEGFALIGDAGNLVDSITGEGIHHAIDSAAALATALHEAGPHGAHRLYASRWRADSGRQLTRAAHWAAHYYRPWAVDRLLGVAQRSQRTRRIVADLLMVKQPYTRLVRRVAHDALLGGGGDSSPTAPPG